VLGDRVLPVGRHVRDGDPALAAGLDVDVVDAGRPGHDELERGQAVERRPVHSRGDEHGQHVRSREVVEVIVQLSLEQPRLQCGRRRERRLELLAVGVGDFHAPGVRRCGVSHGRWRVYGDGRPRRRRASPEPVRVPPRLDPPSLPA
jgi:hypothetical protein